MVKLSYLNEFVSLAETLNFSKTAELSFLTQPALSRHIAALEEEMGAKLLERTTRSVRLTPAGAAVYKQFRQMLESYHAAREAAGFLSTGKAGVLKLSSPYYWTEEFTEPIVQRFLAQYPLCEAQIVSCQPQDGLRDMREGRSDLAISVAISDIAPEIRRVPFATERLGAVFLREHPLADAPSLRLEQIRETTLVSLGLGTRDFAGYNALLLRLFAKRGIHPNSLVYTQQIDTLGLTLKQSGGAAIMPYGARHMDRSYLRFVPLEDADCVLPMCLYYRTDNENPLIPQYIQTAKDAMLHA